MTRRKQQRYQYVGIENDNGVRHPATSLWLIILKDFLDQVILGFACFLHACIRFGLQLP